MSRLQPRFFACLLAVAGTAGWAQTSSGLIAGPMDITARVLDNHNPGGNVYSDSFFIPGATSDPVQSAERLYLAPLGANFSGHSTNIHPAFSSALAQSDGNGGVGVSSWIAGSAVPGTPSTDQLVAQAVWTQSFSYVGSFDVALSFHFEIPALTVGLIGVAPNRSAPSATETASTMVSLTSFVTHADGTSHSAGHFDYGMSVREYQIPLGPGNYANFADIRITNDIFQNTLTHSGDDYNPEWTLAAVRGDVALATLLPGDTLTFEYTLTASGTTLGGEHGYYAFIGDPFGVDAVSGNFIPTLGPVPEPRPALLLLAGLAWLTQRRRRP
jgi:hypothetical protein